MMLFIFQVSLVKQQVVLLSLPNTTAQYHLLRGSHMMLFVKFDWLLQVRGIIFPV